MTRTIWLSSLSLVLFSAGCVGELGAPQGDLGHEHNEIVLAGPELVSEWQRDGDWLLSPRLDAPDGASRVGVLVGLEEVGELPTLEARPLLGGEPIGEWVRLSGTWSEEDHHVAIAELAAIGDGAQLRLSADAGPAIQVLRWNAVIPEVTESLEEVELEDVGAQSEALRSELQGLGIISRSAWGARATRCTSRDATKSRVAIHHTVTPSADPARQVRGIQRFHQDSRGWCDVGYHFLVGIDGTIYEGRPLHLIGAHVGGANSNNIGISLVGCFNSSGCGSMGPTTPSDVMIRQAGRLLGSLSRLYGISVNTDRVRGHGQHAGQSTSCPGSAVRARMGTLLDIGRRETLSDGGGGGGGGGGAGGDGASCTHSYGGSYGDRACSAGYQCCDGRWGTRGSCGSCACVEETGRTGCSAPAAPSGSSCTHSYGGNYGDRACSAGYQCCDGRWGTRGSCGSCACVEETGRTGCSAAAAPPPGASCTHSYGGRYANTACSAAYQCCDGRWGTRGSCGSCHCVEETGSTGCGT